MQLKSITAIVVLLLVVASLLVAGCTTSTTSNTNNTPSATTSTATHNATLEKYLSTYKNASYAEKNFSVKAWEVTWINGTSANLEYAFLNKTVNRTVSHVVTWTVFPTTQDATNYLNAMNKTAYSLASTVYPSGGNYQKVTGHAPAIYKDYIWNEGNPFNISEYKNHEIQQLDNLIVTDTGKALT
jgi:outer membrane murein-binding lipoprotein Lpp